MDGGTDAAMRGVGVVGGDGRGKLGGKGRVMAVDKVNKRIFMR